jgi:hypothetical protein
VRKPSAQGAEHAGEARVRAPPPAVAEAALWTAKLVVDGGRAGIARSGQSGWVYAEAAAALGAEVLGADEPEDDELDENSVDFGGVEGLEPELPFAARLSVR